MNINGAELNATEINGSSDLLFLLREFVASTYVLGTKVGEVWKHLLTQTPCAVSLLRRVSRQVLAPVAGVAAKVARGYKSFSHAVVAVPAFTRAFGVFRVTTSMCATGYASAFAYVRTLICTAAGQGVSVRTVGKAFRGASEGIAGLLREAARSVAAAVGGVSSLARNVVKGFHVAATGGGGAARAYLRQFLIAANSTVSYGALSIISRAFVATVGVAASLGRQASKQFAVFATATASRFVILGKVLVATVGSIPSAMRGIYRTLVGQASSTVSALLGYVRSFGSIDPSATSFAAVIKRISTLSARTRSSLSAAVRRVSSKE